MNNTILDILDKTEMLLNDSNICNDFSKKIKELKRKVEKKQIIIAVVGQFKRGKTTFINTILGKDILPCWNNTHNFCCN
ncbi:MAG: dynamin family protein [Caloramator sp.]|nr:dynamin family protein [Caloramator sp.]